MALNIPWDLFKKLLRNKLDERGVQELGSWKNSSELNRNIYEEILTDERVKDAICNEKWEHNSSDWKKLVSRLKPSTKISIYRRKFYMASSAAAALILFIGISLGLYWSGRIIAITSTPDEYTYIFSPRGQRTHVILPDKTKIWLNSESSIRYLSDYNQNTREVFLSGEAFFEVEKNPHKPFFVYASEIKVKAYGTSFNIKAFPGEKFIETTLIDGKISVIPNILKGKAVNEIFLKPNEKCIYEKTTSVNKDELTGQVEGLDKNNKNFSSAESNAKITLAKNINPECEKLWKDGKLIFKNEPYFELAVKLERWFDVKIHFEDEAIKKYRFTGSFEKETINQAMEALRLSSQKSYKYKINFRDIYLKSE
ncbi:MAG: FecR family protein [Bacteroidales bacterium]